MRIVAALALMALGGGCARPTFEAPLIPQTLPEPGSYLARFAVIGDYGVDDDDEQEVAELVASFSPEYVLTLGDNNYPRGEASTIDAHIGKYYSAFIGDYHGRFGHGAADAASSTNRFWPCVGNHDWYAAREGSMQPYFDYFSALPGNRRYYDVVIGDVHFFSLDSDSHEPDGNSADSMQAHWLEQALAASTSCFNIVYFHHPPISSGEAVYNVPAMRWPFRKWGADVVLTGHQHLYERLDLDGAPLLINGLGGAKRRFGFPQILPESRFRYSAGFGAQIVTVRRDGLSFEFHDTQGHLVDRAVIEKLCRP